MNVYIVERVVPWESGWILGVTDNLPAAKRMAQRLSDGDYYFDRPDHKINWTRPEGTKNYWHGSDGRYDSYGIDKRKVVSK